MVEGADAIDRIFPAADSRRLAAIVTQIVTQRMEKATSEDRKWPVNWSVWPDLNRRPLRPELSAQPGKSAGRRHSGTSEAFTRDAMAAFDRV